MRHFKTLKNKGIKGKYGCEEIQVVIYGQFTNDVKISRYANHYRKTFSRYIKMSSPKAIDKLKLESARNIERGKYQH